MTKVTRSELLELIDKLDIEKFNNKYKTQMIWLLNALMTCQLSKYDINEEVLSSPIIQGPSFQILPKDRHIEISYGMPENPIKAVNLSLTDMKVLHSKLRELILYFGNQN